MAARGQRRDPRIAASRYVVGRVSGDDEGADAGAPTPEQRAAIVETTIQQAIRRGDFDNLPGAGKPLPSLAASHDPDWWIRRKIERERLTGLGPPALTLRSESARLGERLDALQRETEVRDALEDFNRRVIEARRQLLGGPPVVTPTRDVDAEVEAWRRRREARHHEQRRALEEARLADMSGRQRRWCKRRKADER